MTQRIQNDPIRQKCRMKPNNHQRNTIQSLTVAEYHTTIQPVNTSLHLSQPHPTPQPFGRLYHHVLRLVPRHFELPTPPHLRQLDQVVVKLGIIGQHVIRLIQILIKEKQGRRQQTQRQAPHQRVPEPRLDE